MNAPRGRRALVCLFALSTACAAHPPHIVATRHVAIAAEYLHAERWEQAEERCRLALELSPDYAEADNCLGLVELGARGAVSSAEEHFKTAIAKNADFAQAHNNLGTCFLRHLPPDYDTACDEYRQALEIDPLYVDARENLGLCLVRRGLIAGRAGDGERRRTDFRAARSQLIRLLELDPARLRGLSLLATMELEDHRLAEATDHLLRCLALAPGDPVCAYDLGNARLAAADCRGAIDAYVTVLRAGPGSEVAVDAKQNLAAAYELCAKEDGALQIYFEHLRRTPGDAGAHDDLAHAYADRGLWSEAVHEWETAVTIDPAWCPAHFELAMYADRTLDAAATVTRCRTFLECTSAAAIAGTANTEHRTTCVELVRRLSTE